MHVLRVWSDQGKKWQLIQKMEENDLQNKELFLKLNADHRNN